MNTFTPVLFDYLKQAKTDNLKTSTYTKEFSYELREPFKTYKNLDNTEWGGEY